MQEYPYELYMKLENDPHKEIRLTINKVSAGFNAEIDIVFSDGKKIFSHLETIHNFDDEQDLIDSAVQKVSQKLSPK